ncbi:MAG: hypothetical protein E6K18_08000 [Methanobacteriota archaeon]|nr:MAG: hypothetical protein E6K18_08000 [Euryarchaeota archaeon]
MMKFIVGQKFKNLGSDDRLEITAITRYRVYYRITLVKTRAVEYTAIWSTRHVNRAFPATYIEGMLGKSAFTATLARNAFVETDSDFRPLRDEDARWIPSRRSSWGEA